MKPFGQVRIALQEVGCDSSPHSFLIWEGERRSALELRRTIQISDDLHG